MNRVKSRVGGRPPKNDPAKYCYMLRLNSIEHTDFLAMYEQSGELNKASFIKARVFSKSFRVIKVDRSMLDYYQKLTSLYAQFRAVGVNYNQVVVALKSNFTEKKALAFIYKLEKLTLELTALNREIIGLSEEFKLKWSQR